MTTSHTERLPDPFCTMCGGDGWVAGGSYMGDVERIPCECIGRHDEETDDRPDDEQFEVPHEDSPHCRCKLCV